MPGPDCTTARATLLLLGLLALPACTLSRSFDQPVGGAPVFIDSMTDAERQQAADEISAALSGGIRSHHVLPGDSLEVLFLNDTRATRRQYVLGVGDEIAIEFPFQADYSRIETVRSDGKISLPLRGDMMAASKTPLDLARDIGALYAGELIRPAVTVTLRRSANNVEDLKQAVTTAGQGRGKTFVVGPDGMIALPLLPSIRVGGHTVSEITTMLGDAYAEQSADIQVSVHLTAIAGSQVFVMGEVRNPGAIQEVGPRTILQTIAAVGGPLPTGALDSVHIIYPGPDNKLRARQANLQKELADFNLDEDMIVPPNSMIYVPPTSIAIADRFVDQYIAKLFLFGGSSLNAQYLLNGAGVTTATSAVVR